jgi:Caspase domain
MRHLPKAAFVGVALIGSMLAHAERRALVIGNDSYQGAMPLQNARSDARAVAKALERDEFKVTLKEDLTLRAMKEALRAFKQQVSGGDEVVFYFAGHGVQFEGTNYLIPIDLVPQSQEQVVDDSVPLQRVLDDMEAQKTRFTLAIVDACRDNPFKGTGRAIGGRGLAPVTAATGQMIMYSAGAGQEALDRLGAGDSDPNGLFTRVLIHELNNPEVPADQMAKNIRNEVVALAQGVHHEQVPALYDQSIGEFWFVPGHHPPKPDHVTDPPDKVFRLLSATQVPQDRQKIEQELWEQLRQSLPKTVVFGFLDPKGEGLSRSVVGFEPAATRSDGRTVSVRTVIGELGSGGFAPRDENITDYGIDCARGEYQVLRRADHAGVWYPDQVARRSGAYIPKPGDGQWSLKQALCDMPLRITPLWGLDHIEWTDVGGGRAIAPSIRWSDPTRLEEKYVFMRHDIGSPTFYGTRITYSWIGVNCGRHESRDTGFYEASPKGEILKVTGWESTWEQFGRSSVAANVYVLLCDS